MLSRVARRVLRVQHRHQQRCSDTPAPLCALWPQQRCNGGPHKLPTYPVLWQVRYHMGHSHGNHSLPPVDREEEDAELESEAEGGDTTAAARVRIGVCCNTLPATCTTRQAQPSFTYNVFRC